MKTFLRRLDRLRFEAPLALSLAAAAAFALAEMPDGFFGLFPGVIAFPAGQIVLALIGGGVAGALAFAAMKLAGTAVVPSIWEPDLAGDEEDDAVEEPQVRMRRADRHPDAPAREPIRASRDLGQPFMDVGVVAPDEAAPDPQQDEQDEEDDLPLARPAPWLDADRVAAAAPDPIEPETADEEPVEPEPIEPEAVAPEAVEPDAPAPEPQPELPTATVHRLHAVPDPEPTAAPMEPAPEAPARGQRQSIAALMDRLATGVERRGGLAPTRVSADAPADAFGRPRGASADLRSALDELNRLAAHRG